MISSRSRRVAARREHHHSTTQQKEVETNNKKTTRILIALVAVQAVCAVGQFALGHQTAGWDALADAAIGTAVATVFANAQRKKDRPQA